MLLAGSLIAAMSMYAQNEPASIPYSYRFEGTADGWTVVNGGTGESTWSYYDQMYGNISASEENFYAAYMLDGLSAADVSELSSGLYYITIATDQGTFSHKLLKQ